MRRNQAAQILLVEDDPFDVRIFRRTLDRCGVTVPVTVAGDGAAALDILRGDAADPPFRRPHLVLLDLNLPGLDGHGFLRALRADPDLHDTVVLVMTTSDAPSDRRRVYDRNVAGYLIKTPRQEDVNDAIDFIGRFVDLVRLPTR
ncbi:hypothetical protein ATO6_14220 [Oceanicola sp. 22II-s10i]|uniref:response regulator n=1 Tax=Oceanicola sp. 22II-s10i TaxID=1317116 RepID=UPI000B51ED02|nr:response regulator [Oceanicola sp. 22II-s10i]OWU84199.1 hypothetical protein ATO6_14220 [Oceanicola sp. 22II-s10i]